MHYKTPAKEANDVRITSHVIYHEKLRSKVMQFEYCIITKLATDHFSLNSFIQYILKLKYQKDLKFVSDVCFREDCDYEYIIYQALKIFRIHDVFLCIAKIVTFFLNIRPFNFLATLLSNITIFFRLFLLISRIP